MILTYLVLLVLFVGPVGLKNYLEIFGMVSYEKIAALSVTSPYSAAFSIPMRASQFSLPEASSTASNKLPPAVLIPGLGLPVWAAFLMLYPVLAVILYGVTYFAFRVRWWKAGGTG